MVEDDTINADFELFEFNNVHSSNQYEYNSLNDISIHLLDENDDFMFNNDDFDVLINDLEWDDDSTENTANKRNRSYLSDDSSDSLNDRVVIHKPLHDYNELKLFPKRLVNAVNSADINQVKDLLTSTLSSNCLFAVHLPDKVLNEIGFDKFLNMFSNMFDNFPDIVCMLKSVVSIDSNGHSVLDCKLRCSATVSKRSLETLNNVKNIRTIDEFFTSYNPDKDDAQRRDKTLAALNELNNGVKFVKTYVKLRFKIYIDQLTNTITKLDEIPKLSSCELVEDALINA